MKPYKEQTYYELLEVETSASMDEIRAAYERAIRLYDADNVALYPVGDASQVEELKKLLLEAMEILTEPDLRVEYDRTLGLPTRPPEPGEPAEPVAAPAPPEAAQVEVRAAEARLESDHRVEAEARAALEHAEPSHHAEEEDEGPVDERRLPRLDPVPPEDPAADGEPAQLVMTDVIRRAETVHSTAPRYSISYIPRAAPPAPALPEELEPPKPGEGSATAPARTEEPAKPEAPAAVTPAPQAEAAETPSIPEVQTRPATAPLEPELPPPGVPTPPSRLTPSAPLPVPPPPPRSTPVMAMPVPHSPLNDPAQIGASGEPSLRSPAGALAQAPVMAQESAIAAAESALAQVSAHVASRSREPARPRAIEIPPDAIFNGELLRQIRKSRGLSLQQVADKTRISSRHLENVEADRYDALPATVYLRGFLMSLARELGVDPLRVSKGYLALVEQHAGQKGK